MNQLKVDRRILWTTVAFCLGATFVACHKAPPPPPDYSTLKRDLLRLDQSLQYGIQRGQGLNAPERFVADLEQLKIDYRVQKPPLDDFNRKMLGDLIGIAEVVRQAGAAHARYTQGLPDVRTDDAEFSWQLLKTNYVVLANPIDNHVLLAVKSLELAEQGKIPGPTP